MTSMPIPSAPERLFLVTARIEFQYPVLAESREAAESKWVAEDAMRDLGEKPWDITADKAGPDYSQPEGYDGANLVYYGRLDRLGGQHRQADVTWDDAVKADKMYAAHLDVVERLDYTKPPAGFLPHPNDSTIPRFAFAYITADGATVQETLQLRSDEEAIAALWGKVKLGKDPPGMHLIAMGWGPTNDMKGQGAARRSFAWAVYDRSLGLRNGSAPWPLVLTWDSATCEAFEKAWGASFRSGL